MEQEQEKLLIPALPVTAGTTRQAKWRKALEESEEEKRAVSKKRRKKRVVQVWWWREEEGTVNCTTDRKSAKTMASFRGLHFIF